MKRAPAALILLLLLAGERSGGQGACFTPASSVEIWRVRQVAAAVLSRASPHAPLTARCDALAAHAGAEAAKVADAQPGGGGGGDASTFRVQAAEAKVPAAGELLTSRSALYLPLGRPAFDWSFSGYRGEPWCGGCMHCGAMPP